MAPLFHQLSHTHARLCAQYLESIDAHRALAGMQSHKILKGIALPAPAYHLDTKGKPMTKEQVNIIQVDVLIQKRNTSAPASLRELRK
eukprot:1159813-Pelagomonas_calceolata.AAC.20